MVDFERIRTELRKDFPSLREGNAHGFTMLENAGGTFLPRQVTDAMQHHYDNFHVQNGGKYRASKEVARVDKQAGAFVADLMEANGTGTVMLGTSARALMATLCGAVFDRISYEVRQAQSSGNAEKRIAVHIILAEYNHLTHFNPWVFLKNRLAMFCPSMLHSSLTFLDDVDPLHPGFLNPDRLRSRLRALYDKEKQDGVDKVLSFVILPHVSNMIGEIANIGGLISVVREFGSDAKIIVDGVGYGSSSLVKCSTWKPDWYTMSLYKICCPQSGAMYGSTAAWAWLFQDKASPQQSHFEEVSGRTNYVTMSGILGFKEYLIKVAGLTLDKGPEEIRLMPTRDIVVTALDTMKSLVDDLAKMLREYLAANSNVTLVRSSVAFGPHTKPIISFVPKYVKSAQVMEALSVNNVAAKSGTLMSPGVAKLLGICATDGVVRISPSHYNTHADIRRAIEVIEKAVVGGSKL